MQLLSLKINNFKNIAEVQMQLSGKINCFVGNNGAGKTNLLDAIHYLSFTRSYFGVSDQMNIRHGEDFFAIHGEFVLPNSGPEWVSCALRQGNRKVFKANGKEYERMSAHIGRYPVVMVSPYDRDLINEGSEVRRRFIDMVISQFDTAYLDHLVHYNRLLEQRNSLLKAFSENQRFDAEYLNLIDERMSLPAVAIFEARQKFLTEFIAVFRKYFQLISQGRESVDISYESTLQLSDFLAGCKAAVQKDMACRYSTIGIHKDDFSFLMNGFPVKKYGSQGQQKSFVVALKLAQFEFTRNHIGIKPILLFDDIFDKLDPTRVSQIVHLVNDDNFGQVFISDAEPERIHRIFDQSPGEHRIFYIHNGGTVNPMPVG